MRWRLSRITCSGQTTAKDEYGNTILKMQAANILMFIGEHSYNRKSGALVVYLAANDRYAAYIGSESVAEKLTQDAWADIYAKALGYNAMMGGIDGYPVQEINI